MTLDIRKGKYRFQQGGFTDKENNTFAPFEPKHKVRVGGFMTLMTVREKRSGKNYRFSERIFTQYYMHRVMIAYTQNLKQ